jgi:hypothetical protein
MYALEHRHRGFVLALALGCALSSAYGFLAGTCRPYPELASHQSRHDEVLVCG